VSVKQEILKPLLRVYIQGSHAYEYIKMFLEEGFLGARSIEEADIVCFTGGEDVNPDLYDEKPLKFTAFNSRRDAADVWAYTEATRLDKFIVGICRGGQFLNVMNGGKMWQHVDNHTNHHNIKDVRMDTMVWATSTHHQQMIPNIGECEVVAVSCDKAGQIRSLSTIKESFGKRVDIPSKGGNTETDYEVLFYNTSKSLCFQPHPEFSGVTFKPLRKYFFDVLDEFYFETQDDEMEEG